MVRKTKENAELTRQHLIQAAREVFLTRGVSRTTMEHIAIQAGVTRGAIYWHFSNKIALFQAMREQVFLPLIDRMDDTLLVERSEDPLACIENFLCGTIQVLMDSIETRQIYEIMMIKCEYVDEFATVLQQILSNCSGIEEKLKLVYERARAREQLHASHDPSQLATDTHLFFIGLLHMWVKDTDGNRFRYQAIELVKSHMRLRRR
ncbi:TetR family transcriptional regulator [Nitrosospira sp. NpAV]|uniref:TetR family transcriptional regulator n=1 Tax=Nitrosospira sp. NpAV TaxID=58133 RepID=UPI0005A13402|nr:TetR family transcriptional regulator [Nitrosospira sp. NpAV]KIO50204.1 TetR family transcriptional regulator [Nitrosospira sp. NpAV]